MVTAKNAHATVATRFQLKIVPPPLVNFSYIKKHAIRWYWYDTRFDKFSILTSVPLTDKLKNIYKILGTAA